MSKQFRIFGTIINDDSERWSMDDVTPSQFNSWLRSVPPGEDIELAINSPGGSVTAGLAIANMVASCANPVTARVYGIAASMASVIACAAPTLAMFKSSFMMIHNPWAIMIGNADSLRKEADVLDAMRDACVGIYAAKFPTLTPADLAQLMSDETWMLGSELSAYGLECAIEDDPGQMAACVRGPAMFAKIPDAAKRFYAGDPQLAPIAPPPAPPAKPPQASVPLDVFKQLELDHGDLTTRHAAVVSELDALQARFTGMQSAKDKEIAALKADHASAVTDFKSQLATLQTGLDSARAETSAATEARAKSEQALAATGEQLVALQSAHALLTGAVLKPAEGFASFMAAVAATDYVNARKQYPELYDAFMAENARKAQSK